MSKLRLTFGKLVQSIIDTHQGCLGRATKAVNVNLTLRNWLIGYYIQEYTKKGVDRATYGERLVEKLSVVLEKRNVPRCDRRELYRYCQFYITYPQIVESLPPQFKLQIIAKTKNSKIVDSVTPQLCLGGKQLLETLSFTHFAELLNVDDSLKRVFYEHECLRGNWSVRELKRQIDSLYYERCGLSKNKQKLVTIVCTQSGRTQPEDVIRDPYVFEFLGIKPQEVMDESTLETALLNKLQSFLLELGHGFCFEARQKRIPIDDEFFYVDLVFYHRVLKCHILIEMKTTGFSHENLGQLNTYVNWYRKHEMSDGDNPPIGILLCTRKNQALVEYAKAGITNKLFVSRYQLLLPKKEEIQKYLTDQMRDLQSRNSRQLT
ncbi:MAG TPA: PDDEXK nuclease domain-containing protein [bacterium]|nr:PDDEXK nuclease domain-containing protein [bacterium]